MNPYGTDYPHHPPHVFVDGDINTSRFYEIERFLDRRVIKKGKRTVVQYLVR